MSKRYASGGIKPNSGAFSWRQQLQQSQLTPAPRTVFAVYGGTIGMRVLLLD